MSTEAKFSNWSYIESRPVESDLFLRARERSYALGVPAVSPAVAKLLTVLCTTNKASTVVEVGTGAGVSGLALLAGMTSNGVLTTIDTDADHIRAAKEGFAEAGYRSNRTRTIIGRAEAVLPRLADQGYDVAFLDGAVADLPKYVEQSTRLVRPGGLIIINDALDQDRVPRPQDRSETAVSAREAERVLNDDDRFLTTLLGVGTGLLLAVRRH